MAPPRTAALAAAAAVVAAALAIPGLAMPFLSDDWAQLTSSRAGERLRTPVGDFRPAAMATIALDDRLWSGNPRGFHATNMLLIAAAAALVVLVAGHVTGSHQVAGLAGLLFAIHPWHVENAAWIAARGDPLYAVPLLAGALAWLRWRDRGRGIPWAALVLFEIALLAKESAVAALAAVAVAVLGDRACRRSLGFWARGVLPFAALALGHAAIRTVALEGPGRIVLGTAISGWPKNLAGMGGGRRSPARRRAHRREPGVVRDRSARRRARLGPRRAPRLR